MNLVFFFIIKIVLNSLIFSGWLFIVTYGIDLVSIPRYYILYRTEAKIMVSSHP